MIYRDFKGLKLSMLGMGTMRLPTKTNEGMDLESVAPIIDECAAQEMIDYAIAHGINYFDTAWGYHDGNSELVVGRALARHKRDEFYLATKFPSYDVRNMPKAEEIFEKQLEKCKVDYFDFFLLHNICAYNINEYFDPQYKAVEYFIKQREAGRIKHLGFSSHASTDVLKRFLAGYGSELEFCQLQVNWIDWDFRKVKEHIDAVRKYNMPVWVMEPLRGGKLVQLNNEFTERMKAKSPKRAIPQWSFDFLSSIPDVTVILSGMSDMEQLKENIALFDKLTPLKDDEIDFLFDLAKDITQSVSVPCTACRYCTSACPKHLDIPELIRIYNDMNVTGKRSLFGAISMLTIPYEKFPDTCIGCRSCEKLCPQEIKISEAMKKFSAILDDYSDFIKSRKK